MKLRKLNSFGFSHFIVPIVALLVIGGVGVYLVGIDHADPLAFRPSQPNVPVLFVHGFNHQAGCTTVNSSSLAAPLKTVLTANKYTGPVVPIDYYCGDKTGVSIRGAGGPSTAQFPQNGYNDNTPIERIGFDLAWFIYNTYTVKGQTVSIVSTSMGGLVATYAITHSGQPGFPPSLLLQDVITYATPFAGVDKQKDPMQIMYGLCGNPLVPECTEMVIGSPFLTDLAKQTIPSGVNFTAVGGGQQDILTYASATNVAAQHKVNYNGWSPIAYNHKSYITDTQETMNMPGVITNSSDGESPAVVSAYPKTGLPHSLKLGYMALTSPSW